MSAVLEEILRQETHLNAAGRERLGARIIDALEQQNPRYLNLSEAPEEPCPVFTEIVLGHRLVVTYKGKTLISLSVRQAVLKAMSRGGAAETRFECSR